MSFDHVQGLSRLVNRTGASTRLELVGSARANTAAAWAAFAPADIRKGDLIVVSMVRTNSAPPAPAGYTLAQTALRESLRHAVYFRVATADADDKFANIAGVITNILVFRDHGGVGIVGKLESNHTYVSVDLGQPSTDGSILIVAQVNDGFTYATGEGSDGWANVFENALDGARIFVRSLSRTPISKTLINLRVGRDIAAIWLEVLPK